MNFDVRTEPWIPVRALSGEKKIFGLEAVLEQAQDLDGMDGLDTMAEYSLYRFLTVFLMTVYRPKSWRDKYRLLEHGSFEANKWKTYIQHCIDEGVSFDIFDVKRPFLQAVPDTGYDLEKNIKSAAELDNTKASGNNPIHFDHTLEESVVFTPAAAVRGLLSAQIFCTAGLKGPSNVNGAPPLFFLPKGKNLFETLVYAMAAVDEQMLGEPLWESKRVIVPKEEVPSTKLLYGMLFPSRRIRLIEENGMVRQVYYQPGLHFTGFAGWTDPHVAYRVKKDEELVSIKPSTEREPWRHIGPIEERFEKCAPQVLRDFSKIQEHLDSYQMPIMAFGVATSNASYLDMQRGMIELDSRVADKPMKAGFLAQAVEFAERIGWILQQSMKNMISPKDSKRGDGEVKQYIHHYFSECEKQFYVFEQMLAEANRDYKVLFAGWQRNVKRVALEITTLIQQNCCYRATDLVRAQQAENWLNLEIYKLMKGESKE